MGGPLSEFDSLEVRDRAIVLRLLPSRTSGESLIGCGIKFYFYRP